MADTLETAVKREIKIPGAVNRVVAPKQVGAEAEAQTFSGKAMMKVGKTLVREADVIGTRIDKVEFANARSAFLTAKVGLDASFDDDKDFATFEKRYAEQIGKVGEAASSLISNQDRRGMFRAAMAPHMQSGMVAVRGKARVREADHGLATLNKNTQTAFDAMLRADNDTAQDILSATSDAIRAAESAGYISEADAVTRLRTLPTKFAMARISLLLPEDRLMVLNKNLEFKDGAATFEPTHGFVDFIPADKRMAMIQDTKAEIDRANAAAYKAGSDARALTASNLEIDVKRGVKTYSDVEAAFEVGSITAPKRTQLTLHLDEQTKKANKEAELAGRVAAALTGQTYLDPKDSDDRKGVNAYYKRIFAPSLAKLPQEAQPSALVDFIGTVGMIPAQVERSMRTSLTSGDVGARTMAADFVARIEEKNPMLLIGFSKPERQLAEKINRLTRSGVPAKRAVEIADGALRADPAEKEVRQAKLRSERLLDTAKSVVSNELAGGFLGFGEAAITDALVGEYRVLYREHYLATGDKDAAKKLSIGDLKRVWGVSSVGGDDRLMKYPPEAYGVTSMSREDNAEWMKEQLGADLTPIDVAIGDVQLVSDVMTARDVSRPTWMVMHIVDGVVEPVMLDGKPMRWNPDWNTSPMRARLIEEQEKAKKAAIDAAQVRRDAQTVDSPDPGAL
jgi:hypothetical protein